MPNWTTLNITMSHKDKTMIDKIMDRPEDQGVLQTLIPCPEELCNDELTTWGHGEEEQKREALRKEMIEKYGFKSWYDWNIANWGTKWDLCDADVQRTDDNTIVINCQTAWSPPDTAFETLHEQGYEIRALYVGEGYEFAGIWEDGSDNYYQDFGDSEGARATLPKELDDMFNISDSLAEYEEEERREEELYRWTVEGAEAREKTKINDDSDL